MSETQNYTLLKKQNEVELRQYAGYLQAEVDVIDRDYRPAIVKGFRVLAGYIFGNNIPQKNIGMKAAMQASRSRKGTMTAPDINGRDTFTVAFIMPSEHASETLPLPKDPNIRFTPFPAQQMAAIQFSGYFRQDRINRYTQRLSQWLEAQGLETEGDFIVAGYNPPWAAGFRTRNEVLIRIKS